MSGIKAFVPYDDCLHVPLDFPGPMWRDKTQSCRDLLNGFLQPDPAARVSATEALQHPWVTTNSVWVSRRESILSSERAL